MAIGNFRTATGVSQPVRRGGNGGGRLTYGSAIPHLTGAGEGFRSMERMGASVRQLGMHLERKGEEIADRNAAEAAQRLQSELGESMIGQYGRQGVAAGAVGERKGAADEWTESAGKRLQEVADRLDPLSREKLKGRMAPWIAGRRENLMVHEMREVRRGRIAGLENDMKSSADFASLDILSQVRGEDQDWRERAGALAAAHQKGAMGDDEYGKAVAGMERERQTAFARHVAQLVAETDMHESRFADAVREGLFSQEEAVARCRDTRRNTFLTTVNALLQDGRTDAADAILDALEGSKYGKRNDGKTEKGSGWLGELPVKGGGVATEYSIGVKIDGKEMDIPTLVPTLSRDEIKQLTDDIIPNGKEVPYPIAKKAVAHAKKRLAKGESVFKDDGEAGYLAAICGFGADELAALRGRSDMARRQAESRLKAEEREATEAFGREITQRELAIRDVPEEMWADAYEQLGRDEQLRTADPARAMRYLDAARDIRKAEAAARVRAEKEARQEALRAEKEARESSENDLATALCQLQVLELDGSIPQEEADEAQAAIWRKFRTAAVGRSVSPAFMQSFQNRMSTRLTDQEKNAMRKFYRAFGYAGEFTQTGEIPAAVQKKDDTTYYAPQEDATQERQKIKAKDLFAYGGTLLRTLRALGPDMNREGVVDREIARLKTDWIKAEWFDGKIRENADATVRSILDMQREMRTQAEITALQGATRKEANDKDKETDDGKRGNDDGAAD